MKYLILESFDGQIVRNLPWLSGDQVFVVRRLDTLRIEVMVDLEDLEVRQIPFEVLMKCNESDLVSGPLLLGTQNRLRLVNKVENTLMNEPFLNENPAVLRTSVGVTFLVALAFAGMMISRPEIDRTEEVSVNEPKVQVKVVKRTPPKLMQVVQQKISVVPQNTRAVKMSNPDRSVKRMGALTVLGNGKAGSKGGLNLGAANASAGPGLGGNQGSGGMQKSLYGKGLISAPLGEGGNMQGGGGYGTKGKGGGQAGYGSMSLAGSSGGSPIPLGKEAIVQGGIDRDLIASVVERNQGQIRFCYEQGLQGDPNLTGRIVLEWTIGSDGLVKTANVSNTTLHSQIVEDCLVARLRGWKFPLPAGSEAVKVSFPFLMQRRRG